MSMIDYQVDASMKDTVRLTNLGTSIGFTIVPSIQKKSELEVGDPIQLEIYEIIKGDNPQPTSVFMSSNVIRVVGQSKGVSIKKNIVDEFKLKNGDVIGIDIKKEI